MSDRLTSRDCTKGQRPDGITAWAEGPGTPTPKSSRAEGPAQTSVPRITLVELHPILRQHRPHLVLEPAQINAKPCTHEGQRPDGITAWAEGPGTPTPNPSRAEGPAQTSIPRIPLVKLHPILRQHCPHLVLKTPLRMVRLLVIDIPAQRLHIRRPNGKQAIPTLPTRTPPLPASSSKQRTQSSTETQHPPQPSMWAGANQDAHDPQHRPRGNTRIPTPVPNPPDTRAGATRHHHGSSPHVASC